MLWLLFGASGESGDTETPVTPPEVPAVVVIETTGGGGGLDDDDLIIRYDLADDQDMQDLIMMFEAFRSLMNG